MINRTPELATEAFTSFADPRLGLSQHTLTALARMGIETPTPIQEAALPPMLAGRDVIGQARTGSGKTLAFGIPAIEGIDPNRRSIQVLILTPTRELANQIAVVLEALAVGRQLRVGVIFGGRAYGPQREMLARGVQVVVGTPGRVVDLLNQGALRFDDVRQLVLDEADEMLDQGFARDVEKIIARTNRQRRTALFSATMPAWVRQTADKHLDRPVTVAVNAGPEDVAPIEHTAYELGDGDKVAALRDLLDYRGEGSVIVFGRTKHGVKKLAKRLTDDGFPVAALQGNLSQNARDRVMADFRSGAVPILLATNVAARGLDVENVSQVINVELPESPELLTHRIGRTGRMGRQGQAITLLGREDAAKWRQLERGLKRSIPRAMWPGARAVVGVAPDAAPAPRRPMPTVSVTDRFDLDRRLRAAAPGGGGPRRPLLGDRGGPRGNDRGFAGGRETVPLYRDAAPTRPVASAGRQRDGEESGPGARGGFRVACSTCGGPADVPFQPDPSRPVYCGSCFRNRNLGSGRRTGTGIGAGRS